jgi:two-component system, OmpR family, sensor histidine kinase BaeS
MLVFVSAAVVTLSVVGRVLDVIAGRSGGGGELLSGAAVVVLAVGLLALVAVARTIGATARPLDDLVDAAGRLEAGDYSARVATPARAPRGLRDLVRGFNTMAERLENDEAQRRELLADVSHELRTPLAVVQGNIEAILDGVYPADAAHLEPLLEETRVLLRLVEDLRTVTLAAAGTLALHREPSDLGILVADVAASFGPVAATAGVELAADSDPELPLADVDPVRVREVLVNLVANALRHTPQGGRVALTATASNDVATIRVSDTGAGIAPELLGHVFDRFAKGAESRGSGLGLTIARGLVEAHGGTIRVTSRPAVGTTFEVELPLGTSDGRR